MTTPGSPIHLVRRFFGSLRARRPTPGDQVLVASLVTPEEARLFWAQPVADQAHGVAAARRVAALAPDRDDLVRAALLHDVGKRHARLGVIGRSVASLLAILRLPRTRRHAAYLSHGDLGAADLAAAGSDPVTVAFARDHHRARPDDVAPDDWKVLVAADTE